MSTVLLVDLASIVYPLWAVSGQEPDQDWTANRALAKVRSLAHRYPCAAVCCDSRHSFRREIDPSYKANRPEKNQAVLHQLRVAESLLKADGFPVWTHDGYEADDVIASATAWAFEQGHQVVIASSDKDLMQLVCDEVSLWSIKKETLIGSAEVVQAFGVRPEQMRDYLTLVGDASDNIKGVKGIGQVKAASILAEYDLDSLLGHIEQNGLTPTALGLQPSVFAALRDSKDSIKIARQLVTLRTDAPIDFSAVLQPRIPVESEDSMSEALTSDANASIVEETQPEPEASAGITAPSTGLVRPTVEVEPFTGAWERQLEPRNPADARTISKWLHTSKLFSQYGSAEAVFSIVLAGRELGLGTMASLRGFHVVEGRPTMAADLMRALVLASGKAEYFVCRSRSKDASTWETKRKGDPCPSELTYTFNEANLAGLIKPRSGWEKHPADMVAKTASAKLCRMVYPDVTFGLYSAEEMGYGE